MMFMTEGPADLLVAPAVGAASTYERERFGQVAALPAGAWTAVALDLDPASLPTDALPAYLEAAAKAQAWISGKVAVAVAEFAARPDADSVDATVALALRESIGAAQRRVWWTSRLVHRLPAVPRALSAGDLSERHAVAMVEATSSVTDADILAEVEARSLAHLGGKTAKELARYARRLLARLDPAGAQQRARAARDEADVTLHVDDDGMAAVCANIPVEDAVLVKSAVDAYAATAKSIGDQRRVGVLRAEGLVRACARLLTRGRADNAAPRAGGRPIELGITVGLRTALGQEDLPAEVPGMGIVPREVVARMIATELPKLRLMVIDDADGRLLYRASNTYRPTPEQVAHVRAAYVRSVGPGSEVLANRTDTDHATPYPDGATVIGNLVPLDRTWHRAKTLGSLAVSVGDDGTVTVTTVTGQSRVVTPYDYRMESPTTSGGPGRAGRAR